MLCSVTQKLGNMQHVMMNQYTLAKKLALRPVFYFKLSDKLRLL